MYTGDKKYNSACTFAFQFDHNDEECGDMSNEDLIKAIRLRLNQIENHGIEEIREAVLPPYDTYEH